MRSSSQLCSIIRRHTLTRETHVLYPALRYPALPVRPRLHARCDAERDGRGRLCHGMRSGATLSAVVMRRGACRHEAEETPMNEAAQAGPIDTRGSKVNRAHPRPRPPQVAPYLARSASRRPLSLRRHTMSDNETRSAPEEDSMETRAGGSEVEEGKMPDKQASAALDDMVRRILIRLSNDRTDP